MTLWPIVLISFAVAGLTALALRRNHRLDPDRADPKRQALAIPIRFVQRLALISACMGTMFLLAVGAVLVLGIESRVDFGALLAAIQSARARVEGLDQALTGGLVAVIALGLALWLGRGARPRLQRLAATWREREIERLLAARDTLPPLDDTPEMRPLRAEAERIGRVLLSYAPEPGAPEVERYAELRKKAGALEERLADLDVQRRVPRLDLDRLASAAPPALGRVLAFFTSRGFVTTLDGATRVTGTLALGLLFLSLIGLQAKGASRDAARAVAHLDELVVEKTLRDALRSWERGGALPAEVPEVAAWVEARDGAAPHYDEIDDPDVWGIARWYELTQGTDVRTAGYDATSGRRAHRAHAPPASRAPPPVPVAELFEGPPRTPAGRDFAVSLETLKRRAPRVWEWLRGQWRARAAEFRVPASVHDLAPLAFGQFVSSVGAPDAMPADWVPIESEFLEDGGTETARIYSKSRAARLLADWITRAPRSGAAVLPVAWPAPPLTPRELRALERATERLARAHEAAAPHPGLPGVPVVPVPAPAPVSRPRLPRVKLPRIPLGRILRGMSRIRPR